MIGTGIRALTCTSLLALTALPSMAAAQSAGPADAVDDRVQSTDVVVTANKREERVQDVALSVTAVSGADLNERRLIDVQDLASRVPGFSFSRGGSAAGGQGPGQRIIIRGLNTGGISSTVASVIDDVPLTASAASSGGGEFAADFDPYDLQRIEVLKGPQGTLYGAASLGGLVKYVTNLPDTTAIRSGFDVGFDHIEHGGGGAFAKAFVNVPLSGAIAVRASGNYEYMPGWIGNALGGNPATNDVRRYGGRVSLLVKASDAFTIRGTAMYQERQAGGYDVVEVNGYQNSADPFGLLNGYNKNTYVDEPNSSRSQVYSLNLDYDLGAATLRSITSYGDLTTRYRFDGPFYVPLSGPFFGRANTTLTSDSINSVRKFNQELRIASDNGAAAEGHGLEWQVGAYYTRETTEATNDYLTRDIGTRQPVVTPASVAATPPGTPQVFLGRITSRYREYAGYVDLTYHLSPSFDIEAGGRVFKNEQSFSQTTGGALYSPAAFATTGPFGSSETRATFAVAPRFHFSRDVMVYARAASGYRPGGPNLAVPPASTVTGSPDTPGDPPRTFAADTTINYEVGLKGALFASRLSFDVAAFYIDWSDIQVSTVYRRGLTGYPITLNAGDAVSKGLEGNIQLRPVTGLTLGVLGAYNEATLSQNIAEIAGTKGSQLPFVPKWTTTLTADYQVAVANDVDLLVGGAYAYTGKRFSGYLVDPNRTYQPIPSYGVWSAQAGLRFGRYSIQAYGKNLTDRRGITSYDRGSVIFGVSLPGTAGLIRPREIGIRLAGSF